MFARNALSAYLRLNRQHASWLLHRAFWALMLVIHFGALRAVDAVLSGAGAATDEQSALQIIALVSAAWFCLLKTFDVPWLRGNPGWRPKVASAVIVALLHVSVIERAASRDSAFSPAHLGVFLIGVTVAKRRVVARWLRRVRSCTVARSTSSSRHARHPEPFGMAWVRAFEPILVYLRAGPLGLRAPPTSITTRHVPNT